MHLQLRLRKIKVMKNYTFNIEKSGKVLFFSLFIVVAFTFNSCYTSRDTTILQDSKSLPLYKSTDYTDYKIHPNDELLFKVQSTDNEFVNLIGASGSSSGTNTVSYRVYPDSTIDLPYEDTIKVAGLTLDEASNVIKNRYREILPDAEVKLTLANKTYTVIGEVGTGVFDVYKDRLTIYQALAQAGEIKTSADRRHVKIIREIKNKTEILEFDIRPKSVINSQYYYIYPNDIIYVQKSASSFYKANNYSTFLGLITSSISLFITVFYFNKSNY